MLFGGDTCLACQLRDPEASVIMSPVGSWVLLQAGLDLLTGVLRDQSQDLCHLRPSELFADPTPRSSEFSPATVLGVQGLALPRPLV